jgi:hypothetical protein
MSSTQMTTPGTGSFASEHLVEADDLRHRVQPGVPTRDSLFWNLILPDEQVGVQLYAFGDGRGLGGRQVVVYRPEPEPMIMHSTLGHDLGDDSDFDDWRCAGMRVRQPEPLRTAQVDYASDEVSLEYTFTATHRPFSYLENAYFPHWMAANRYEQTGLASGTLRVGEREIRFQDVWTHRDHSWGRRHWTWPHHWKWLVAGTPSGQAINAMISIARGEVGVNGYVLRDGQPVALVDARARAEYDEAMGQVRLEADLIDVEGRTTTLEMERYALFTMSFGSDSVVNEAACRARIDGEEGTGQFEARWPRAYLQGLVDAE